VSSLPRPADSWSATTSASENTVAEYGVDQADTEPLPALAPWPAAGGTSAPKSDFAHRTKVAATSTPSTFSPGGEWWDQVAQARTVRRDPTRLAVAVGVVMLVVAAGFASWFLLRPSAPTAPAANAARIVFFVMSVNAMSAGASGQQCGHRDEVLMVNLHRVRGRLAGCAVNSRSRRTSSASPLRCRRLILVRTPQHRQRGTAGRTTEPADNRNQF
jgi:hypothetical protein